MNFTENITSDYYKVGDHVFARDFMQCRWFKGVINEMVRDPMAKLGSNACSPEEDGILYMVHLDNYQDYTLPLRLPDIRPDRESCPISELVVGERVLLNNNKDGRVENTFWYDFVIQEIIPESDTLIGTVYAQNDKIFVSTKVQCNRNIVKLPPYSLIRANKRARSATSSSSNDWDMETDDSFLSEISQIDFSIIEANATSSSSSPTILLPDVPRPQLNGTTASSNGSGKLLNKVSLRVDGSGSRVNGSALTNGTSPQLNGTDAGCDGSSTQFNEITALPDSSGREIDINTMPSDVNTMNVDPLRTYTSPISANAGPGSKIGKIRVISPERIRAAQASETLPPSNLPQSCSRCTNRSVPCPLCECVVCKAKVIPSIQCLKCRKCAQRCHQACAHLRFRLSVNKSSWMCPKCKSLLRAEQEQTSNHSVVKYGSAATSVSFNNNVSVESARNLTVESPHNLTIKSPPNVTVKQPHNSTMESPCDLTVELPRNLIVESSRRQTVAGSHSNNTIETIDENFLRNGIAKGYLMENKISVKSGTASIYKRVNAKCVAVAKETEIDNGIPHGLPAKSQFAKRRNGLSKNAPSRTINGCSISNMRSLGKNEISNVLQQNRLQHKTQNHLQRKTSHIELSGIPTLNSDTLGNVLNNNVAPEAKETEFYKSIVDALTGSDFNNGYANDIVLDSGFSISVAKSEPRDDDDLNILDLSNFTPNLQDWDSHMDVVNDSDSRQFLSGKKQNLIPNMNAENNGAVARENGMLAQKDKAMARENCKAIPSKTIRSRLDVNRESVENISPDDKGALASIIAKNQSEYNLKCDKSIGNKLANLSIKQAYHLSGRKTICTSVGPNHFGPIPGVEVGTRWRYRVQASEAGVHRPMIGGIAGRSCVGAYSIVLSGSYPDDYDNGDEFFYTGSGSSLFTGKNKRIGTQVQDQSLTRFNLALARSCNAPVDAEHGAESPCWQDGKPIRVIRTYKLAKISQYAPTAGIRYDGIYKIVKYYPYRGTNGFLVWRYFMRRDDPTPAPWTPEGKQRIKELGLDKIIEPNRDISTLKRVRSDANENVESSDANEEDGLASLFDELNALPDPSARKRLLISSDTIDVFQLDEDTKTLISLDEPNMALWNYCKTYLHQGKKKFLEIVADTFKCVICQQLLNKPVTTPCYHSVCLTCLTSEFGKEKYNCPTCQEEINVDFEANINRMLDDTLSKLFQ